METSVRPGPAWSAQLVQSISFQSRPDQCPVRQQRGKPHCFSFPLARPFLWGRLWEMAPFHNRNVAPLPPLIPEKKRRKRKWMRLRHTTTPNIPHRTAPHHTVPWQSQWNGQWIELELGMGWNGTRSPSPFPPTIIINIVMSLSLTSDHVDDDDDVDENNNDEVQGANKGTTTKNSTPMGLWSSGGNGEKGKWHRANALTRAQEGTNVEWRISLRSKWWGPLFCFTP